MNEPTSISVVLDDEIVIYAANCTNQCHEHINEAIDMDIDGAGKWVVRQYVLGPNKGKS